MNALAISIAVILFPGLLATVICDKIAVHSPKWRTFKYGLYSFIFGVICYIAAQFAEWALQWLASLCSPGPKQPLQLLHVWTFATSQQAEVKLAEVLYATIAAPFVAAIATAINSWKVLTKLADWLKISNKFGDENLFSYYLSSKNIDWVYVRDPSINQTYQGRVWGYSETDHIQEVVLWEVSVYTYETAEFLYSLPTIYLSRPTGTFAIEAIPDQSKEAPDVNKTT
jgi:hypothetical protein